MERGLIRNYRSDAYCWTYALIKNRTPNFTIAVIPRKMSHRFRDMTQLSFHTCRICLIWEEKYIYIYIYIRKVHTIWKDHMQRNAYPASEVQRSGIVSKADLAAEQKIPTFDVPYSLCCANKFQGVGVWGKNFIIILSFFVFGLSGAERSLMFAQWQWSEAITKSKIQTGNAIIRAYLKRWGTPFVSSRLT